MACQAPLTMGFSRQEHWSGLPFPSPVMKYKVSEMHEVKSLSTVRLSATPWTAAHQAPPSMGFSRKEYWSGVPLLSPEMVLLTSDTALLTSVPSYVILGKFLSTPPFHYLYLFI